MYNSENSEVKPETLKELDNALAELKIKSNKQENEDGISIVNKKEEGVDDFNFLDECLQGTNEKLNLTADEKEDLDDLDDEAIQKEYADFMKNIASNDNANDFLSQLNKLMESGVGDMIGMNNDFSNLLGSLDDNNQFDSLTDNLINQFIDKDVIYEPLKEARQKVNEHINADKKNKNQKNIKVLQILTEIINLMDTNSQTTPTGRERIMQLFEELQEEGGLPEEIIQQSVKDNPEMAKLQDLTQGKNCVIF